MLTETGAAGVSIAVIIFGVFCFLMLVASVFLYITQETNDYRTLLRAVHERPTVDAVKKLTKSSIEAETEAFRTLLEERIDAKLKPLTDRVEVLEKAPLPAPAESVKHVPPPIILKPVIGMPKGYVVDVNIVSMPERAKKVTKFPHPQKIPSTGVRQKVTPTK